MYQRSHIKEGMIVRSLDGEKLGKVFAIGEDSFQIEKGLFFPKDYLVRYAEVSDIRAGEIILTHGRESLQRLGGESTYGSTASASTAGMPLGAPLTTSAPPTPGPLATDDTGLGMGASSPGLGLGSSNLGTSSNLGASASLGTERTVRGREDITVPLHKEELDVVKRDIQAGEVRVHKDVVEEEKVMQVPVRRERVRVERRDVTDRPAMSASFQEETVVVPLRAEEVEVRKRAVVDEEVIIHKDAIEEERHISETVRREEVDIRSDGDVDGPRKLNLGTTDLDKDKTRY
jgi:uncharacterized protein (TIGR02271 family)